LVFYPRIKKRENDMFSQMIFDRLEKKRGGSFALNTHEGG